MLTTTHPDENREFQKGFNDAMLGRDFSVAQGDNPAYLDGWTNANTKSQGIAA